MAKNNRMIEEIDEAAMLRSIYERDNPPATPVQKLQEEIQEPQVLPESAIEQERQPRMSEKPKEEKRSKRAGQQEYESLFIRESDLPPARFGKSVYIRKEYHDRISQIVSVIAGKEVSLFGYIDNVLAHHFENFNDEITQAFRKKLIFK